MAEMCFIIRITEPSGRLVAWMLPRELVWEEVALPHKVSNSSVPEPKNM